MRRFTDVQLVIDGAMGSYMGGVSRALRQRIENRDEPAPGRAVLVRTHDDGIDWFTKGARCEIIEAEER